MIDLRSDTVTRPTQGMLSAMQSAQVGDDVWGDDPTVLKLQAECAQRSGHEAGLFLPTGTMSNLAGLMAHCERGDEYIVGQMAHTYRWEGGGAAVLGSIVPQPIEHAADGSLPLEKITAAIKPFGSGLGAHFARSKLLALENTFGGKVIPQSYIEQAIALARQHQLATHLDGARICNAAVANGFTLEQACAGFDTVSICFSKGLGCPAGSVLVGSRELIEKAYRWRKVLGGAMRQSGYLAAACLYALDHHMQRLAQDHDNAARLAQGLRQIEQVTVTGQDTNMVFAHFVPADCAALQNHLESKGILLKAAYGARLVTHLDVTTADVDTVIHAIQSFYQRA